MNYEEGVEKIKAYLKEKSIPFLLVDIVKGSDLIIEHYTQSPILIENKTDIFVIGSYRLTRMMTERNIYPGSFSNEHFNYAAWVNGWGIDHMLNGHYQEQSLNQIEIPEDWNEVFARPLEDNKLFTGGLFKKEDFLTSIQFKIMNENNKNEKVIISKKKDILAEYRFFIVDNKIVTGSLYKMRGQLITSEYVDNDARSYVKERIQAWTPSKAFVMDIAITDEGCKIIEVNNISSAGLYKADSPRIVDAIENIKPW